MDFMDTAQLLGNLGEFVGAIAVVVTLAYLAVQVRQSNHAAQSSAVQSFFDSFSSVTVEPSKNIEFVQLLRRGFSTWDELTKDEQAQMHLYWSDYASKLHMGFRLFKRGVLDEGSYIGWETFFLAALQTPGVRAWWNAMSTMLPADLTAHVAARLADSDSLPPPVTELLPYWAADP